MAPASVTATTAPWNLSQKLRNQPAKGGAAGEPEDRDQRGEQEQLVGDRVEQLPQLAHLVTPAGEVAVHYVRGTGGEEDQERDDLRPVPLNEREQRDDRREADAREGED